MPFGRVTLSQHPRGRSVYPHSTTMISIHSEIGERIYSLIFFIPWRFQCFLENITFYYWRCWLSLFSLREWHCIYMVSPELWPQQRWQQWEEVQVEKLKHKKQQWEQQRVGSRGRDKQEGGEGKHGLTANLLFIQRDIIIRLLQNGILLITWFFLNWW